MVFQCCLAVPTELFVYNSACTFLGYYMFHVVVRFSDAEVKRTFDMPGTGENELPSEVISVQDIIWRAFYYGVCVPGIPCLSCFLWVSAGFEHILWLWTIALVHLRRSNTLIGPKFSGNNTSADPVMFLINLTHTAQKCNKELSQMKVYLIIPFFSYNKAGRATAQHIWINVFLVLGSKVLFLSLEALG